MDVRELFKLLGINNGRTETIVQRIEIGSDRYANCITAVSKDLMVLIKKDEEILHGSDDR